jgi:HSP20 family protein
MRIRKKSKNRKRTARKTRAEKRAAKKKAATRSAAAARLKGSETSLEARLLGPLAEVEKLLGQIRHRDWFQPSGWNWPDLPSLFETRAPSVDIVDRAEEIIVTVEIPGIDKDDLEVSVTDRTLMIKGESRHQEETEDGDTHHREIHRGSFYRTLTLPTDIDGSKVKAECKDGILELYLPKIRGAEKHNIELS